MRKQTENNQGNEHRKVPFRHVFFDQALAKQRGQQIRVRGAGGRAEANEKQRHGEVEQRAREDGQEDRARNGEGLQENVGDHINQHDLVIVRVRVRAQLLPQGLCVVQCARREAIACVQSRQHRRVA